MANPKIVFTGVDQASVVVGKVAGTVDKLKLALTGLAGAAVVNVFRGIVDDLDRLEESAQSAGVAVESLSALRYAATFAGVGAEDLDEALKKLNVQLAAAAGGAKEAQAVFKALGISVTNSSGQVLNSDEALSKVAEKFASFRDGPEKAALAVDLFGRSGTKLIPFLNQGADGLERMKLEAEKLGIVIGTQTASAASKFADQLDRLAAASSAAKVSLFLPIIEGLTRLIDEFDAAKRAGMNLNEVLGFTGKYFNLTEAEAAAAIAKTNKEIAERQRIIDQGTFFLIDSDRVRQDIANLQLEKKALQEIQAIRRVAEVGNVSSIEGQKTLGRAPRVQHGGTPEKEQITEAQRALDAYVDSLQKAIDKDLELSEVEKALVFLRDLGTAGQIPQVRQLVLELAKRKELGEQEIEIQKELARLAKEAIQADRQLDQQLDQFSSRASDALKVAQTARLEARLASGELFSPEELDKIVKGIGGIKDEIEKTEDTAKELGLVFASSIGRWIEAPSETNFFKALLQDLEKLLVQMLIVKPLAEELEGIFKGSGVGGKGAGLASLFSLFGAQDLVGVFASGTDYVPRTGFALVHQGEAIIPAGLNRPGLGGPTININIDTAVDRSRIVSLVELGVRSGIAKSIDNRERGGSGTI